MLLSIRQVVDPRHPPVIRVTIYDGTLDKPGPILDEVPPRPRHSFSRVDFYLELNLTPGRPKQDVLRALQEEREEFENCLNQAGVQAIQQDGRYTGKSMQIDLDYQAYLSQGAAYYLRVFDSCIAHLANTQLATLQ